MEMTKVESSNIKAIGYDSETKRLRVQFASGGIYEYADVAGEVADEFMNAESAGKFFHKKIRNMYETEKIKGNVGKKSDATSNLRPLRRCYLIAAGRRRSTGAGRNDGGLGADADV